MKKSPSYIINLFEVIDLNSEKKDPIEIFKKARKTVGELSLMLADDRVFLCSITAIENIEGVTFRVLEEDKIEDSMIIHDIVEEFESYDALGSLINNFDEHESKKDRQRLDGDPDE